MKTEPSKTYRWGVAYGTNAPDAWFKTKREAVTLVRQRARVHRWGATLCEWFSR